MESGVQGSGVSSTTMTSTPLSPRTATKSLNSPRARRCASLVGADWKALLTAVSALKLKFTGRIIRICEVVCIDVDSECVAVKGQAHAVEATPCTGKLGGRHKNDGVLQVIRIGALFKFSDQLFGVDNGEPGSPKGFHRLVVAVVAQHHAFFQGQQVAGVRPLLPGVERKFVVARIDEFYFFRGFQIVAAYIRQQVLQVIKILGVARILFPEFDDLQLVFLFCGIEYPLDLVRTFTFHGLGREGAEKDPDISPDLGKDGIDVHIIPLFRDPDDGDLFNHILFKQDVDGLVCRFEGGPLADADQEMVFADHHDVAAFEGNLVVVAFPRKQKMVVGIGKLDDLVLVLCEERVVEEDVFGQERFPGPGLFGRLVEQNVLIDDDADVARENKVGNGGEQHPVVAHGAADESLGEPDRFQLEQVLFGIIRAIFDGTDRGDEFQPDLLAGEYVGEQPLELHHLFRAEKVPVARFVERPLVLRVIDHGQLAPDFGRVKEVQQYFGVKVVFLPADRIQVNDILEQPVLSFGRDDLSEATVGAVDEDPAESAYLRGDGNGVVCLVGVVLYHLQN